MPKANTKPYVAVATVCEKVLQEADGVFSAVRIVDILKLTKHAPPPQQVGGGAPIPAIQLLNLNLLVILRSGDVVGPHRVSVFMVTPKEERIPLPPMDAPVVLGKGEGEGKESVTLTLAFGLPINATSGQYWFDIDWDGETLTRVPLRLQQEEGGAGPVSV